MPGLRYGPVELRARLAKRVRRFRQGSRPALNQLDDLLSPYLDFDGGVFVEAGANDGYEQSNTYRLEAERGWSGLLVEGIPDLAKLCAENRPRSAVVNCALVADDYTDDVVTMQFADLMSVVSDTFGDPERAATHVAEGVRIQHLGQTYSVDVPARTLGSVLDEAGIARIDFMSLDVEGYEENVLRGLDFSRHRPRLLLVEWSYGDVGALLEANGFEPVAQLTYHDHLFRDTRAADDRR